MMGETSYYNPATVYARKPSAEGAFGRIFYAEGDYVHDMDLGFYEAYQYSGGEDWKRTASYPPMLYPTHSIGGVLGAWRPRGQRAAASASPTSAATACSTRTSAMFGNDFSNATALFELSTGGSMRINEMRRVGYPSHLRESRFRFFGTEASFEQLATVSCVAGQGGRDRRQRALATRATLARRRSVAGQTSHRPCGTPSSPGWPPVHDAGRLPRGVPRTSQRARGQPPLPGRRLRHAPSTRGTLPPVNAWEAARYTLPGIVAHESALRGGERLPVPDHGDAPVRLPAQGINEEGFAGELRR